MIFLSHFFFRIISDKISKKGVDIVTRDLLNLAVFVFSLVAVFGFLWWIVLLIKRLFGKQTVKDEKGNEVPISERITLARGGFLGSIIIVVVCYLFANGFTSPNEVAQQLHEESIILEKERAEKEAAEKIEKERKEQEELAAEEERKRQELADKEERKRQELQKRIDEENDDKNNHDFIEVTARDLMGILKSNAARANALFNGKYVKIIDGIVVNIESDGDFISIDVPGNLGLSRIQCFPKYDSTREQIFYISNGQYVTVYGQITDVGEIMGYSLKLLKIE